MFRPLLSSAGIVVALFAVGCGDDFDDVESRQPPRPPSATGTLVFDWSIEGRQDAEACVEVGAVSFDAIVVDEGFVVRDLSVPCEDFEASFELYVDDFLARSSLLDERRVPAVGRIIEDLFVIDEGKLTHLVMDFSRASAPTDPTPDAGAPADAGGLPDEVPDAATSFDAGAPDAAAPDAAP